MIHNRGSGSENLKAELTQQDDLITQIMGALKDKGALPGIPSKVLSENSWELISAVSRAGKASEFWSVGDKISVDINGSSYEFQIIGFNHDDVYEGSQESYGRTKAGITFQMVNLYSASSVMNQTESNVGGWNDSYMRNTHLPGLKSLLSESLVKHIVKVNKTASEGNASFLIDTTTDDLFLLSEVEVKGYDGHSFPGEGSQYAFYKAGNSAVKTILGTETSWWLRSACKSNNHSFCIIFNSGVEDYRKANIGYGIAFAFCV